MAKLFDLSKEFLDREYTQLKRSADSISKELNCSKALVLMRLTELGIKKHRVTKQKIDITSHKIGKWTVLNLELNNHKYSRTKWKCLCECGNVSLVSYGSLVNGNSNGCMSCRSRVKTGTSRGENKKWTGIHEMGGSYLSFARNGAKQRNLLFNITIDDMWNKFIAQDRRCSLSGILLVLNKSRNDISGTASLDRIDSSKGYAIDNIQWVHKDINRMKMNLSEDYFIQMCGLVYLNRGVK